MPFLFQSLVMITAVIMNPIMSSAHAVESRSVGTVTLVIGQSMATDQAGQQRLLQRAGEIFVGDIIETDQSAHLHIHFIDDGRISVRPDSRLHVEAYRYDREDPGNSAIRFFLEQGVLRSISGKATEAAHDRYRMNTPVAALGVLGTDYVVRTTDQQTIAAVYSGAIALSPFDHGCNHQSFGACMTATVLSAEMGNLYLEVNQGENESRLKSPQGPADELLIDDSEQPVAGADSVEEEMHVPEIDPQDDHQEASELHTDEVQLNAPVNNAADNDLATNAKLGTQAVAQPLTPERIQPKMIAPEAEAKPPEVIVPEVTSPKVIAPLTPVEAPTLSWVRWPWQDSHAEDTLSVDRQIPAQQVTIGNTYAGLFRDMRDPIDRRPDTGIYNFKLHNSHVVLLRKRGSWQNAEAATLNKADLQVDFGKRQFDTRLEMSAPSVGSAKLNVTGDIDHNGLFGGNNDAGKVSGALSQTGNKAGMAFEKSVNGGTFSGITEWHKQ